MRVRSEKSRVLLLAPVARLDRGGKDFGDVIVVRSFWFLPNPELHHRLNLQGFSPAIRRTRTADHRRLEYGRVRRLACREMTLQHSQP